MRTRVTMLLAVWFFTAAPLFAQPLPPPSSPGPLTLPEGPVPPSGSQDVLTPGVPVDAGPPSEIKFWVRAEFLNYWVKNAPLPVSLVTGDPANPTQELLNSSQNFGSFGGFKGGFGIWFDSANTQGIEANAFFLQRRSHVFFASSDDTGSPTLAFPFNNQTPGAGQFPWYMALPGMFAGDVTTVTSRLELWGTEANGVLVLIPRTSGLEFTALAGFRYVDLRENLNISTSSADLLTTPNTILFQSDSFNTRNQFFGGQLGGRLNWRGDRFGFDLTGKLGIGGTHNSVDIQGFSTQVGPGGINGTFPGGFFTQPGNIGRFTGNQFSLMPALEMKLFWFITPHVHAFVGYDYLYWNNVVRPGNQVDRNINYSQSGAIFGPGTPNGPNSPTPFMSRSDFWVQGISLGLDFRF